jgi:hypothetical protein
MRKNLSKGKTVTVYQDSIEFKHYNARTRQTNLVELETVKEAEKAIEALQAFIRHLESE